MIELKKERERYENNFQTILINFLCSLIKILLKKYEINKITQEAYIFKTVPEKIEKEKTRKKEKIKRI